MNEIVFEVLVDANGNELPIDTLFVERTINVPTLTKIPLYVGGELKSESELAELGLVVKGYTQDELDAITYPKYYAENPDLANRVREYKAILDKYGLTAEATSDDIQANVSDQVEQANMLKLIHDIELNYHVVTGDGFGAYLVLAKLIQYLP